MMHMFVGKLRPLSPRVAGHAVEICADENEDVLPKQVLVRIDPRDYDATGIRGEEAVAQAEAVVEQSKAKLQQQNLQIAVAKADVDAMKAIETNAAIALARATSLVEKGTVAQVSLDLAPSASVTARASVTQARAKLDLAEQEIVVFNSDVRAAETRAVDAKTAILTAKVALEDTQVWSPIGGTVASRRTRVGEYVTVGPRMLAIVPQDGLWIEANFRGTQLQAMKPGQPVSIRIDTFKKEQLCGYVEAIGPAAGL